MRNIFKLAAVAALALGSAAGPVLADYPQKPVSFIVPFPPGDIEDLLTRVIAEDFQTKYGVPTAVVNKPGGGGGPFPGAMEVGNGPNDGTLIGSFVIDVPTVGPQLGIPGLNEDTFEPLGIFFTYPFILAASGDAPYSSLTELAEYAKNNKVALGHFGAPLVPTQVALAAAADLGFSYGSDAAFDALDCNTLASGDVDVITTTMQQIAPCVGDIKILATLTSKKIAGLEDVPSIYEVVGKYDISLWNGLFVKKGTSQEIKDKIIASVVETLEGDKFKEIAKNTKAIIYWKNADEAKAQIEKDLKTFEEIAKVLGN